MTERSKLLAIPAAMALACSACSGDGADSSANGAAAMEEVDVLPPDESVATPTNDLATGVIDTPPAENALAPNPDTAIPAALHGRWGLTAADCRSERDDARGLVTIAADRINFYESVGVPTTIRRSSPTGIEAEFAFTGEGMTWSNPMIWSVEGRQLVRIDSEADSRLVYTRCPPGGAGLG